MKVNSAFFGKGKDNLIDCLKSENTLNDEGFCASLSSENKLKKFGFFNEFYFFDKIDSTNKFLKENSSKLKTPCLIVAKEQTKGKGKNGAVWFSLKGKSATFSMLFDVYADDIEKIGLLTMCGAVSVAQAIEETGKIKAKCKWPNDVLINGKKVCGILTESEPLGDNMYKVIIGIGVNLRGSRDEFPDELKNDLCVVSELAGREISDDEFFEKFFKNFTMNFKDFICGNHKNIIKKWEEKVIFKNG